MCMYNHYPEIINDMKGCTSTHDKKEKKNCIKIGVDCRYDEKNKNLFDAHESIYNLQYERKTHKRLHKMRKKKREIVVYSFSALKMGI